MPPYMWHILCNNVTVCFAARYAAQVNLVRIKRLTKQTVSLQENAHARRR